MVHWLYGTPAIVWQHEKRRASRPINLSAVLSGKKISEKKYQNIIKEIKIKKYIIIMIKKLLVLTIH